MHQIADVVFATDRVLDNCFGKPSKALTFDPSRPLVHHDAAEEEWSCSSMKVQSHNLHLVCWVKTVMSEWHPMLADVHGLFWG